MNFWKRLVDNLLLRGEPADYPSERAYAAELARRRQLNDVEFYDTFYGGTVISSEIPVRLRRLLARITGDDLRGLWPGDNIAAIYEGLDFADVLYRVEREFDLRILLTAVQFPLPSEATPSCPADRIDGTFDSLVRYLVSSGMGMKRQG